MSGNEILQSLLIELPFTILVILVGHRLIRLGKAIIDGISDDFKDALATQANRYETALQRQSERHQAAEERMEKRFDEWRKETHELHVADRRQSEQMTLAIQGLTKELERSHRERA